MFADYCIQRAALLNAARARCLSGQEGSGVRPSLIKKNKKILQSGAQHFDKIVQALQKENKGGITPADCQPLKIGWVLLQVAFMQPMQATPMQLWLVALLPCLIDHLPFQLLVCV